MKCIDKKELIQFIKGKLDPEQLLAVDEHLAGCPECKAQLRELPGFNSAKRDFGTAVMDIADCPDYGVLSAYVDGALPLDERAGVESHANLCEMCCRDIDRIRELRSHATMRQNVIVRPGMSKHHERHGIRIWKRTLAGVTGAAVLAVIAFGITNMHAVSKAPVSVAVNPTAVEHSMPGATTTAPSTKPQPATVGVQPTPELTPNPVTPKPSMVAENPNTVKPTAKTMLSDGSYKVIQQNGKLAMANANGQPVRTALEARVAAAIDEKLRTGKIKLDKPVQMAMASIATRGGGDFSPLPTAPKLVGPKGKVLMSNRPGLVWKSVDLAESYRVRVYDSAGRVVVDEVTQAASFTPSQPLQRGQVYTWRVGVRFSESDSWAESTPAKFRVISDEDSRLIAKVKNSLPGSHLALGVAYESAGLTDEAQQEYRALRRANRHSDLAKKLLYGAAGISQ
ncbi:MAG: zf-HC2 domain-containing protein [Armatimonadota bacterium]|nr:zf-HC2 domain-containing protein [bacterium]